MNFFSMILFLMSSFVCCAFTASPFGYISYSTYNIGDDIQAVAAKRFLPEDSVPIDREMIGVFQHACPVKTLMNGWYMHTKEISWYRTDIPAPEKSWPPSPSIKPLFIAMHFIPAFVPLALSAEGVEYLKQHAPIGARDLNTLRELRLRNIPSYFLDALLLPSTIPMKKGIILSIWLMLMKKVLNISVLKLVPKYELLHMYQISFRY